jgi:hypothetical protein
MRLYATYNPNKCKIFRNSSFVEGLDEEGGEGRARDSDAASGRRVVTARITAVATQRSCFLSLPGHPIKNPKFPRSQSNVFELTIDYQRFVIDRAGIGGGRRQTAGRPRRGETTAQAQAS